ncbi:MAG: asparagine synthase (glutamine-hydrolyzing) [Flavobacteriales bacterium]|nr:asparagine synthase (glutamine-hydrolyzing) [Flavobacteriales bacterium]
MCGIHGFVNNNISSQDGQKLIQLMTNSTLHRGPDYSSTDQKDNCYFGHNRLSILDLSESGNQPMFFQNYSIVFNGEIYNYKEIREELKQFGYEFVSDSDTEVILKGFDKWGSKVVNRFIGMWAFAIYNSTSKELFCSRDRFGIKPFYYIFDGSSLYFASEIKSLKKTPAFSNELNLNQISRGLQLGWMSYRDETYFTCVKSLEPGKNMFYKESKIKFETYWQITSNTNKDLKITANFKSLFDETLALHMRSDVPVGASLSGGLDSSSIVCSIIEQNLSSDLHTFSIYYEGKNTVDERPFIFEIEKKYKDRYTSNYYSPATSEVAENFHEIAMMIDFPMSGSSCISHYSLMELVERDGIKVIISGQGADDYMGGYLHSYYRFFADKFTKLEWLELIKEFNLYRKYQEANFGALTQVALKSLLSVFLSEKYLYTVEFKNYMPFLMKKGISSTEIQFDNFKASRLDSFHQVLMNYSSLPTILHYEDRISMAKSVETRVPFLDHRLVEMMFNNQSDSKIKNGYTKPILRNAMQGIIPDKIQYRKDKKGFVTPGEVLWLRGCLEYLLEIDYELLHFLDKQKTKAVIEDFKKGNNKFAKLVWRVACLNYWLKN